MLNIKENHPDGLSLSIEMMNILNFFSETTQPINQFYFYE